MPKDIIKTLKLIFSYDSSEETTNIGFYGSIFFTLVSVVLTVVNIAKSENFMTVATTILAIGFIVDAILAHANKRLAYKILMVVLCGVMFTAFALKGGNDGFAILWMLLVPLIGILLVGFHFGFILSLYFLIFVIVIFYTPLNVNFAEYYTDTFMLRFPLLYLASFGAAIIVIGQKRRLSERINYQANHDAQTGLYNRRYYNYLLEQPHGEKLEIVSIDINGLKRVNDSLGHSAGDEIIQATGQIIKDVFKGDECCRVGGDEFIIISEDGSAGSKIETFNRDIENWHGKLVDTLSVSLGTVSKSESLNDMDDLIREADKEMYKNKKQYYDKFNSKL